MSGAALRASVAPTLERILRDTQSFAEELAGGAAARDRERDLPFFAFDRIRAAGIGTLRVPERLGGPGGSITDLIEAITTLAYGEPNVAHSLARISTTPRHSFSVPTGRRHAAAHD